MRSLYVLFGLIILISFCLLSCKTIIRKNENVGISPSIVIFTFDDGPNQRNNTTEKLLDILNKYQVKGVFCLLGVNVENNPEIVRRIKNEEHIIVNHGYSDKFVCYMNDEKFIENLHLGEKAITDALGFEFYPKLYRPQGGIYTSKQQKIVNKEGYVIMPFTIAHLDPFINYHGKERLIKKIIKSVIKQNGGIILLHDRRAGPERSARKLQKKPDGVFNRSWIPETVEEIIIELLDKGFILDKTFDFTQQAPGP